MLLAFDLLSSAPFVLRELLYCGIILFFGGLEILPDCTKSFCSVEFCAGVCSLRKIVEIFGSYGTESQLTCFTSSLVVSGLLISDISVRLNTAVDVGMASSADVVMLADAVGDDVIMSSPTAVLLLTAGTVGDAVGVTAGCSRLLIAVIFTVTLWSDMYRCTERCDAPSAA